MNLAHRLKGALAAIRYFIDQRPSGKKVGWLQPVWLIHTPRGKGCGSLVNIAV